MTLFFTNKNYRLLFSASAVSNLGDGVSALALPWLASLITRDPMLIATVAFATRLPWFLCSIPAGVITDRYDRKHLMVGADILRMILTAGLVVCALTIPQPAPAGAAFTAILMVSGLAFLLGLAEVVRDNAAQTVLPSVVAKSDLERANGQLWSIEQIMGAFIGPPLAGFLIAWAVPAPFVLDTLSFALAAGMVFFIAIPSRPAVIRRSVWREAVEGMVWIRSHRVILQLALMLGVMNALGMLVVTILVLYSQEVLGLSVTQHGLLLIAGAAGGVVGGLIRPKNSCLDRPQKSFALRASGRGCEQCAAGACAFCADRGTGAVFGNVCGTVVECGDCVVPPALYSRCVAGAGQQHIPFFRVGFASLWGAGIRCDCGHGRTGPRPGAGFENAVCDCGGGIICNIALRTCLVAD